MQCANLLIRRSIHTHIHTLLVQPSGAIQGSVSNPRTVGHVDWRSHHSLPVCAAAAADLIVFLNIAH